ncbi:hypothetical protein ACZ90_57595 [Streptomyces albus subsp. albus]|nr:hypothetical protein ACZ90_57595 [Streptomyces albus subsp. albus]
MAGSCVQQPVAELLRLGGGQFAFQQQSAHPGEQVEGGQRQLQPRLVDGEVSRGEATETGGLAAADAVLDAGVRLAAYFQVLQ